MKIEFEVFIKSENKTVYPIGFVQNQFDKNIIRLYFFNTGYDGHILGMPYHINDIDIKKMNFKSDKEG